jgi:hypothetical protein
LVIQVHVKELDYHLKTNNLHRICTWISTVALPLECEDWHVHFLSCCRTAVHLAVFEIVSASVLSDVPELKQDNVNVGKGLPPFIKQVSCPGLFSTTRYVDPAVKPWITGGPSGASTI